MHRVSIAFIFCIALLLFCTSCFRRPEVDFSYKPLANPESGERITFTNTTLDALYYHWDFGNGQSSEEENPVIVYEKPGDYDVLLVAENEYRSDSLMKTILINPPTILEVFVFYRGEVLPDCTVRLWTSEAMAAGGATPKRLGKTDMNGRVAFENLGVRSYFIYMDKPKGIGSVEGGGTIEVIELNKINSYIVSVGYYLNKKSLYDHISFQEYDSIQDRKPVE